MKFRLYGSIDQTDQIGSEITMLVTPVNGIFTVKLDFLADSFPAGSNRWLEVQVNATTLSPRTQLLASPFAIRSLGSNQSDALSAICNPCVTDAQIIGISGSKVSGTVDNANTANSATNAVNATNAANASNLGGVAASNYLQKSGGTITGNLIVNGTLSGDGSGLTNLPSNGFSWQFVTGTTQQAVSNKGYVADNAGQVTITLPTAPNVGDVIRIHGTKERTDGGWKIAQNPGQFISRDTDGFVPYRVWTPHEGNRTWTSIASSTNGARLAATVGNGQIYTSIDAGVTWTPRETSRNWTSIASSMDESKLAATVSDGQIYISTNAGTTWTPQETGRYWTAIAGSQDLSKLFATTSNGQIYTNELHTALVTTMGGAGSLDGDDDSDVELIYKGSGKFIMLRYEGNLTFH